MTIAVFPFPQGEPYFQQPWTILGVQYQLTFRFNTRAALWFMSIADGTGQPILSGIAMHASRNLLGAYASLPLPAGVWLVYDQTGAQSDPGLDSFSSTHQLWFVSK